MPASPISTINARKFWCEQQLDLPWVRLKLEMFYLNSTLNFGIPPVLEFQLKVFYKADGLLTDLIAQEKGTIARWYSNKTSLTNSELWYNIMINRYLISPSHHSTNLNHHLINLTSNRNTHCFGLTITVIIVMTMTMLKWIPWMQTWAPWLFLREVATKSSGKLYMPHM